MVGVASSALLMGSIDSSNGGVFGSLYGTPIINLPQSAVLGACLCYASRKPHDLSFMGENDRDACHQRSPCRRRWTDCDKADNDCRFDIRPPVTGRARGCNLPRCVFVVLVLCSEQLLMGPFLLSWEHTVRVKEYIEDPRKMLLA